MMTVAAGDVCPRQGKLRYATRSGAHVAARRMSKRRPANGIKAAPCHVYRCPACHAFDVGHSDFTKARK
jgi:hypothetical protein